MSVWKNILLQFASVNSIVSNTTALTVQRSRGSWENMSNPWIFVGLQCWEREGGVSDNMGHSWEVVAAFCSAGSLALEFFLNRS